MANHRVSIRSWLGTAAALLVLASTGLAGPKKAPKPTFGDIETFARVPAAPGFPEGVVVDGNRVYVSGPARFGTAGTGPSAIQVYDRKSGALTTRIVVAGEALAFEHALSNMAVDDEGRIYALSTQLGLLRFTKKGNKGYVQETYGAPLPELPRCADADAPCSPTNLDLPPLPNDIVFDAAGFAYVTDSFQATIFRYAPGGGAPEIWFQSPLLEGNPALPFGTNGLRLDPARANVYFAVTTSFADLNRGAIYRVPLIDDPGPADLALVRAYTSAEGPDQLAFGASGEIYVTLAGSNQIAVLAPDGTEITRIQSAPGDAIPLDAPAGLAFDSRTKSLLVVNHALFSANPAHFAVLRVYVGDPGNPLEQPVLPDSVFRRSDGG